MSILDWMRSKSPGAILKTGLRKDGEGCRVWYVTGVMRTVGLLDRTGEFVASSRESLLVVLFCRGTA